MMVNGLRLKEDPMAVQVSSSIVLSLSSSSDAVKVTTQIPKMRINFEHAIEQLKPFRLPSNML